MEPVGRRDFMRYGFAITGGLAAHACATEQRDPMAPNEPTPQPVTRPRVAIAYAPDYGSADGALRFGVNLIGGLSPLVRGKTVTVKVNLSGWGQWLFDRPATETYVVHDGVALALAAALLDAGASRIRFVESAPTTDGLDEFARRLGWDVDALHRLGSVEFINTRSGGGSPLVTLPVPGGRVFSSVQVNRAYAETDVFVSLAKMKNHMIAGVTLGFKNLFGMPPNTVYGADAPSDDAVGIRALIHDRRDSDRGLFPGELPELAAEPAGVRVPYATVDLCAARPIHLTVIDGIDTIAGGEGPWNLPNDEMVPVSPRVLIVGTDPVATDVVTTAVMGYAEPTAPGCPPFHFCENHLALARDRGLGEGKLADIAVVGSAIADVRTPFAWLSA